MILAGDVGGTKCNLGLFLQEGLTLRSVFQRRLATRDYAGFEDLVEDFLKQAIAADANAKAPAIDAAGFGVAGGGAGGGGEFGKIPPGGGVLWVGGETQNKKKK